MKCHVIFDQNCNTSQLCLSKLAIHNLKLETQFVYKSCEISEYPTYLGIENLERRIFPSCDRIVIQPVTPFPDCINNDKIDLAIKDHFRTTFKFPLSQNHQIVIPIDCYGDLKFASVFKISKIEPETLNEQVIFGDNTEVFLKLSPNNVNEKIPTGLQQSLSKSLLLPQTYLFTSYPMSSKLEEFFKCNRSRLNPLSTALVHGPFGSGKRTLIRRLADNFGVPICIIDIYNEVEPPSNNQKLLQMLQEKFIQFDLIVFEGVELLKADLKLQSIWSQISSEFPDRNLKLICVHSYLNSTPISDYILGSFDIIERIRRKLFALLHE